MIEPAQQTQSTPELQLAVSRFMSRAEDVLGHPLAGTTSNILLTLKADPATGKVVGADFEPNLQDKNSWGFLATMLRPLIFLTNDDGSVGRLMNLMKRDHPLLRGHGLEEIKKGISSWRKQPIIAVQDFGPVEKAEGEPAQGNVTTLWTGKPGTRPESFDVDQLTPDFELADVYFNGRMWHADAEKVDEFERASPGMQKLMAKCAEVRTLGGAMGAIPAPVDSRRAGSGLAALTRERSLVLLEQTL